jgi:transposase
MSRCAGFLPGAVAALAIGPIKASPGPTAVSLTGIHSAANASWRIDAQAGHDPRTIRAPGMTIKGMLRLGAPSHFPLGWTAAPARSPFQPPADGYAWGGWEGSLRPGQPGRRSHDDQRHGTLSLFAALDVATGKVIGRRDQRHRAREFLKFLRAVGAEVPRDLDGHLVMDNYATYKTPTIRAWLARRPHWHVHLTPTSASWLNQIERFFAELTNKQLRRGVHRSLREREHAIRDIDTVDDDPKPFCWTRSADVILASIQCFCTTTLDAANQPTKHDGDNFRIGTLA